MLKRDIVLIDAQRISLKHPQMIRTFPDSSYIVERDFYRGRVGLLAPDIMEFLREQVPHVQEQLYDLTSMEGLGPYRRKPQKDLLKAPVWREKLLEENMRAVVLPSYSDTPHLEVVLLEDGEFTTYSSIEDVARELSTVTSQTYNEGTLRKSLDKATWTMRSRRKLPVSYGYREVLPQHEEIVRLHGTLAKERTATVPYPLR